MSTEKIIDKLSDENWFFAHLLAHPLTATVSGGVPPTYKYDRVKLALAVSRALYSEVPEKFVELESVNTNIANIATAVSIDVDLSRGSLTLQRESPLSHALMGVSALFNEMVIRGDSAAPYNPKDPAVGPASFDGLDKIIKTESAHVWDEDNDIIDLTGLGQEIINDKVTTTHHWLDALDILMARLGKLRPSPTFILGNDDLIAALSALARRTDTYTMTQNDFGDTIESIQGISLISMGNKCAKNEEIIPTHKTDTKCRENPKGEKGGTFETTAYVGSFGNNAIMGLELPGDLITFRTSECKVDIEMHIGMAVMSKHACGMFTHICLPKRLIEHSKLIE